MFSSLSIPNYRFWFAGALISNTGAWMQRTAQDWIVLTELTDRDAVALGITTALQFGPTLLLMPISGLLADRLRRRTILIWTQSAQGVLALALGLLLVLGHAELWHVYVFALLLGVTTAIDVPSRQSFVSELVPSGKLPNAVSLNATSFQSARLIGPALAGVLIATTGSSVVFFINAASFGAVIIAMILIRPDQLQPSPLLARARGQLRGGLTYVRSRSDLVVLMTMVFVVGAFGLNFPILIATMATIEFNLDATGFGALTSLMAVGAIIGSLLAARRERARFGVVVVAATAFGCFGLLASLAPSLWLFGLLLVIVGGCTLTMLATANAYVQSTTDPTLRGRVMAIYMAVFMGGTPLGAPIIGLITNEFGPRWAVVAASTSGFVAAAIAISWLVIGRGMRVVRHPDQRFRLRLAFPSTEDDRELLTEELALEESAVKRGT